MYKYMYTGCIYLVLGYAGIPACIIPTVQTLHYCPAGAWRLNEVVVMSV